MGKGWDGWRVRLVGLVDRQKGVEEWRGMVVDYILASTVTYNRFT